MDLHKSAQFIHLFPGVTFFFFLENVLSRHSTCVIEQIPFFKEQVLLCKQKREGGFFQKRVFLRTSKNSPLLFSILFCCVSVLAIVVPRTIITWALFPLPLSLVRRLGLCVIAEKEEKKRPNFFSPSRCFCASLPYWTYLLCNNFSRRRVKVCSCGESGITWCVCVCE